MNIPTSTPPSSPSGPMTRARAKLLQDKVNSLLSLCDFDTPLNGLLLHANTLYILRYEARRIAKLSRKRNKEFDEKLQQLLLRDRNLRPLHIGVSSQTTTQHRNLCTSLRSSLQPTGGHHAVTGLETDRRKHRKLRPANTGDPGLLDPARLKPFGPQPM